MAFEQGSGAGGGSSYIPPTTYGFGGGGNAPPTFVNQPSPYINLSPINLPAALVAQAQAPAYSRPDYGALLGQYMGPQESAFAAQMAALQDQVAHERGFAQEAYGINKEGAQAGYDTWLKDFIAKLVGRGMYNSGARNYYTNLQKKALARQLGLLANSLHSYLYGLQSQVTNAQLSGNAQLAAQRSSLGMQLPSMYPATVSYPNANPFGAPGTANFQG